MFAALKSESSETEIESYVWRTRGKMQTIKEEGKPMRREKRGVVVVSG
jgi:hypothetical protein